MSQFSKRHFYDIDIIELIHQYKQHECLWNIHSPDYKSKSSKQRAWLEIAHYFQKNASEVKRKIQYMRTAYVFEKRKVDASRKNGTKIPYKPSLFYYKDLDFLDNMVIWRKFGTEDVKSNGLCFENIQQSQDGEENEEFISFENNEDNYLKEPEIKCKTEIFAESEITISPLPEIKNSSPNISYSRSSSARPGKRKLSTSSTFISTSAATNNTENLYFSFGKTIALQLQQLPMEVAILTMSEIHIILTKKTLEHIKLSQNRHESLSPSESEDYYSELIEETFNDSS